MKSKHYRNISIEKAKLESLKYNIELIPLVAIWNSKQPAQSETFFEGGNTATGGLEKCDKGGGMTSEVQLI